MDKDASDPVVGIVRSFSDEASALDPDDTLTNALAVKVADDRSDERQSAFPQPEWQRLFYDAASFAPHDSYEQKLLSQTQKLTAAWEKFVRRLPRDQQMNLRSKPPSLTVLFDAVDHAQQTWQRKRKTSKSGRFKEIFGGVCRSFDDYKSLFWAIPADDKYICLLTGTLSTIITATMNHDDIAEGISDGLDNLCDDIFFWRRQLIVFQDEPVMQRYSMQLYIVVFEFLVEIFSSWSQSSWDRFRHSFDRKYFDKLVRSRRERMAELASKLDREANLATQRHVRKTPTQKDHEAMFYRYWEMTEARLQSYERKLVLGGQAILMVTDSGKDALVERQQIVGIQETTQPGGRLVSSSRPDEEASASKDADAQPIKRADLDQLVNSISDLVQTEYLVDLLTETNNLNVDSEVYERLHAWTTQDSLPLWIEGPYGAATPSVNTLTAASLIYTTRQSNLPVLFHFCGNAPFQSRHVYYVTQLLELVYSLVAQLVTQLPPDVSLSNNLREMQIEALDRSPGSLKGAINLLDQLLQHRPSPLLVIVDGLEAAEDLGDKTQINHLTKLVNILSSLPHVGEQRVCKVCFATAGNVNTLGELLAQGRIQTVSFGQVGPGDDQPIDELTIEP